MDIDDATRALTAETLRRSCERIGSENGALWIAEQDHLVPVIGHGPHAEHFIGDYKQPLTEGIISMVYASGQPFCENSIRENPNHSARLDQLLGIHTDAMIAAPVVTTGSLTGVITFVHTTAAGVSGQSDAPRDFSPQDMDEVEFAAAIIGRVLQ